MHAYNEFSTLILYTKYVCFLMWLNFMYIAFIMIIFFITQGNVLVERPPLVVNGINGHLDIKSRGGGSSGNSKIHSMHSLISKDPPMAGSSSHHHNHNHHYHKRHHSDGKVKKSRGNNAERFGRTAAVLRHAGLMKLTLQISQLIKTNEDLQKEIDELQKEAMEFNENLKIQIQQKLSEQNGTGLLNGAKN